jgi:DNA-binding transcriptional regulator GbsR (MarR family)
MPPKNNHHRDSIAPGLLESNARREMIDLSARLCQLFGMPKSTGQVYGLLYLSSKPLSLDDIVEQLGISKASASLATRQLLNWGAIRQIMVLGQRRDFYEVVANISEVAGFIISNVIRPRVERSEDRITQLTDLLNQDLKDGSITSDEFNVLAKRVETLKKLQTRLRTLLPYAERLL